MKNKYKFILFFFATILMVNACTEGFDDINTNPNRVTSVEPEYIFGLTTVATLRELSSDNSWFFFGNYSQQWAVLGGGGPHFGFDGRGDRIWNNLYINALNPIYSILNDSTYAGNPAYTNRVAIAKIWKSYIMSIIVGTYGAAPYSNACNAQSSTKFDTEEEIYRGILADLKEAYTALDPDGDKYPEEAEPFLGSDIKRWSQFAHCIRLNIASRLTEVSESLVPGLATEAKKIVAEELDNAENGLLISKNDENFFMQFGVELDNQNPLFRQVIDNPELETDDPGNFPVIHESFSMWIRPESYNDPCAKIFCKEGSGGSRRNPLSKFLGRPHSMGVPPDYVWETGKSSPYNSLKYVDFAQIGKTFSEMTAKFYFFSYPELCLLKAEATLKGYWTKGKSAEEYYYDGIDARCQKYGISGSSVTNYKNFPGIKWSTPSDTVTTKTVDRAGFQDYLKIVDSYLGGEEDNFKRIIVQHWISLFGQTMDAYTLLRRTQVIPFKPHFEVDQNNGYVNARWGYTPERLVYPGNERIINREETQYSIDNYLYDNTLKEQRDQVTFRLIYAKPQIELRFANGYPYDLPNMARNRVSSK